jgi:hypothetical protein
MNYFFYRIEKNLLKICRKILVTGKKNIVFNHTTIASDSVSTYFKQMLLSEKPCMIGRLGSIEFDSAVYPYILKLPVFKRYKLYTAGYIDIYRKNLEYEQSLMNTLCCNAGFFPNDPLKLNEFSNLMLRDLKEVDLLGVVPWNKEDIFQKQLFGKQLARYDSFEPYDYADPWSKTLEGKKVLVVHPFSKSIKMQYEKRKLLFQDQDVLPDFELKTLKAIQTIGGKRTHFDTWFDALDYMKRQIDDMDFDIAIIGCGAYGFHLAAHIKRMGKKAVHLGGATQILFGIKGKRWEAIPAVSILMNDHWVRPLPEETPEEGRKVEGGCYW